MKCKKCYMLIKRTDTVCPNCGEKQSKVNLPLVILLAIVSIAIGSFFMFFTAINAIPFITDFVSEHENTFQEVSPDELQNSHINIELIEEAQQTVYTIYTDFNQGSGFLYDTEGYVITNAHVVEGSLHPSIKTIDGNEYEGDLIGYSNEIDVALIYVSELKGETPFPQEKETESDVGIEVAALGTPLGRENTATFGYLTGVNRTFNLPPHKFKDVYQISAPIEPGNSGGPLISMSDGKIIAINAAKRVDVDNTAFSIPLKQVVPLVNNWIKHPMSKTGISSLFYDEDGNFYYDLLWSLIEHYFFDEGYYLDDEDYHHYWYYDEWDSYDDYRDYDHNWNYDDNWDDNYEDEDWNYYDDSYDYDWEENEDWEYDYTNEEDWYDYNEEWNNDQWYYEEEWDDHWDSFDTDYSDYWYEYEDFDDSYEWEEADE